MTMTRREAVSIAVDEKCRVSGLLQAPRAARACYVPAHGAGAGMSHPFMTSIADGLAERDVATLRYQFPYMEEGGKRPDKPEVAQATVRAAVDEALRLLPGVAFVAGGKSFGGRMTSQAQVTSPLPGVQGLVFLGFPLHPAGRPSDERGAHLYWSTEDMTRRAPLAGMSGFIRGAPIYLSSVAVKFLLQTRTRPL